MEEKKGLFDPKNAEAQREGRRKGGATTNGKKRICLVTGKISAPGPLAQYQKSRGIPTHLYTDLDGCDLVSQTMLMGLALM